MKNPEKYFHKETNKMRRDIENIILIDSLECSNGMIKQSLRSADGLKNKQKANFKQLSMISSDIYNFYCGSMHCSVGPLNADESALIRLRFRLWSRNLAIVISFKLQTNKA